MQFWTRTLCPRCRWHGFTRKLDKFMEERSTEARTPQTHNIISGSRSPWLSKCCRTGKLFSGSITACLPALPCLCKHQLLWHWQEQDGGWAPKPLQCKHSGARAGQCCPSSALASVKTLMDCQQKATFWDLLWTEAAQRSCKLENKLFWAEDSFFVMCLYGAHKEFM